MKQELKMILRPSVWSRRYVNVHATLFCESVGLRTKMLMNLQALECCAALVECAQSRGSDVLGTLQVYR